VRRSEQTLRRGLFPGCYARLQNPQSLNLSNNRQLKNWVLKGERRFRRGGATAAGHYQSLGGLLQEATFPIQLLNLLSAGSKAFIASNLAKIPASGFKGHLIFLEGPFADEIKKELTASRICVTLA
jgi:hypothetical protein